VALYNKVGPWLFCLQVEEEEIDDPDLSLRLNEGLREHTTGEIQTVIASAADANIYRSAAAFEDIITDKNLLRVCWQGTAGLACVTVYCGGPVQAVLPSRSGSSFRGDSHFSP